MFFEIICVSSKGKYRSIIIKVKYTPANTLPIIRKALNELNSKQSITDQFSYVKGSWKEVSLETWLHFIK